MNENITTKNFYDIMIPSAILTLVVAWCVMILFPFTSILLWGLILTLALAPMHHALSGMMGRKQKLASFIIVLSGLVLILLPGWLFLDSIMDGARELKKNKLRDEVSNSEVKNLSSKILNQGS